MPANTANVRRIVDIYNGKALRSGTGLFEHGVPDDAADPKSFIMRVNRQILVRSITPSDNRLRDLATAISAKGCLGLHAELIVFGTWMLCDAMPGSKKRPGKTPDLRKLFKVAGCAFAALKPWDKSSAGPPAETRRVATKDVAGLWKKCFDAASVTADHSSALRSLRKILPDYLDYLKAGQITFNGQKVTSSPWMKQVAKAIKEPSPARGTGAKPAGAASAPAASHPGSPTTLTRFDIPLGYSSAAAKTEYRGAVSSPPGSPCLSYSILPVRATSAKHGLRADRVSRVVFKPDFDLVQMAPAEALIDRIALVVSTKRLTSHKTLQFAVSIAGAKIYAADRTFTVSERDFHASLPELDPLKPTGQHFAILVQDATPTTLRSVLDTIEAIAGIEGEVRPFLLELAVDFYPDKSLDPSAALLAREQIVGLVQRHHWSAGGGFDVPDGRVPRSIDQRQVYWEGGATKARYFFANGGDRQNSDRDLDKESVRHRLLSKSRGNDLYLNATIYRGNQLAQRRINNQHKIADKRNPAKGTSANLPDQQRRARMEITLSSLGALEQAGLKTIGDLARCSFRHMSRNLLVFRLPSCAAEEEAVEQTITQMTTRGIYGVEMNQRAQCHEEREQMRPKPRKTDHDGLGLADWPEMNALVGAALDRLRKKWGRF